MPQVGILIGARVVVHSFVDGARIAQPRLRETEDDALAHALWLRNQGKHEQAEEYLDSYIQRNSGAVCR